MRGQRNATLITETCETLYLYILDHGRNGVRPALCSTAVNWQLESEASLATFEVSLLLLGVQNRLGVLESWSLGVLESWALADVLEVFPGAN